METDRILAVHRSLEIRINFRTNFISERGREYFQHGNLEFRFEVTVYPDGFNEDSEGWLVISPVILDCDSNFPTEKGVISTCLLSVIDIEGNSRFPRSFEMVDNRDPASFTESLRRFIFYLERSFILSRAEELLSGDVLTFRCDFFADFDLDVIGLRLAYSPGIEDPTYAYCRIKKDPNGSFSSDWDPTCLVYDFTTVLSLPEDHEFRKRFGVHEVMKSFASGQEVPRYSAIGTAREDIGDILEHIWMFDVFDSPSGRFLLSLDEREDSLGTRLLESSPVIKRMVNADMKERREKCIELANVKRDTFENVLHFLAHGETFSFIRHDVMDVYEFSHLYEMKDLQRLCAKTLVHLSKHPTEFDELKKMVDLYSDGYLSKELRKRQPHDTDVMQPPFQMDDVPLSDCYI